MASVVEGSAVWVPAVITASPSQHLSDKASKEGGGIRPSHSQHCFLPTRLQSLLNSLTFLPALWSFLMS